MTSFETAGMISFRTKCLTIQRAGAFARALGNNSRFTAVEIRESKRARGEARWYVSFLPSNPARVEVMLAGQQATREERASTQSFTVVQDPDHDYMHVFSHATSETYEVSIAGATCTCPDHAYRLRDSGILCKHLVAAARAVREERVGEFQPVPDRRAEREADKRRFAEIFSAGNEDWLR